MSNQPYAGAPTASQVSSLAAMGQSSITIPYALENYNPEHPKQNEFPVKPIRKDPYDTDYLIKKELTNAPGGISSARPLPYTERDIDYIKRKRDDEEYAAYSAWLGTLFNLEDPAQVALFKQIAPSYFTRREEVINEAIDMTAKYAKLRLFGAQTEEDLKFQWQVETGRVILPNGPIWDPLTWIERTAVQQRVALETDDQSTNILKWNKHVYEVGMFSPFRVLPQLFGGYGPNKRNRTDIYGDPASGRFNGPLNMDQPNSENYAVNYSQKNPGQGRYQELENFNRTMLANRYYFQKKK